jgi:hypothetical protein
VRVQQAHESAFDGELFVASLSAQRVLARDGSTMRLRQVWGTRTAVQVFLRHFGCLFCHQMVAEVLAASHEIVANGAHVVLVGCGTLEQGLKFAREKGIPREGVELYCDPGRETYEAASLDRSYVKTFLSTGAHRAYTSARRDGHANTGRFGDVAQLGGVAVITAPAHLHFLHRSRFAGDHPDVADIIAAVARARS